ncbi:hypothetical protein CIK05_07135 [Bdellovibrio sp. qaytius]|nr:hypothetical protein CIK05_07135 [Bdellovibrio sp. qaytius]
MKQYVLLFFVLSFFFSCQNNVNGKSGVVEPTKPSGDSSDNTDKDQNSSDQQQSDKNWIELLDGVSLQGWRALAVFGGNGGLWTIEKEALVAQQEPGQKGGLLATVQSYSDFELEFEFKADFPVDSGVYLRTDKNGIGYQITLDYRKDGLVGSVYFPEDGGLLTPDLGWEKVYKKTDWNLMRIKITGWPAHITVWLNGKVTVDFTDTKKRYTSSGFIGLQVHSGSDIWGLGNKAYFRNIRLLKL